MSEIVVAPNSVLGEMAKNWKFENDKDLKSLLKQMEKALLSASDPKGVGLAAPQIGRSLSIFIAKPTEKSKISIFINPKIVDTDLNSDLHKTKKRNKRLRKLEGCLSLPNIWGEVLRSPPVTLEYQTLSGDRITKKFTGFMATIVQHEVDHLHGILFPRRVLEQKGRLYQSYKNEKNEDEFEELVI